MSGGDGEASSDQPQSPAAPQPAAHPQRPPHLQRHHHFASSRFSDALTFKDWLRRVYNTEDKALKVSVRNTDVVRPVLQHLYASRAHFHSPIIVHANTFQGNGPGQEKPVDVVQLVDSARQLLPDAVLSLGWTPSEDWSAVNRLDWRQAFQLLALLRGHDRQQPVMLNMRLNDAVHSVEVLEWLLGVDQPAVYLVLRGDVSDFVDSDSPLRRLARLRTGVQRRRLIFDVDENWRTRIRRFARKGTELAEQQMPFNLLNPSRWLNWLLPSSAQPFSTSIISPAGVAFIGWPSSLLLSTKPSESFPRRQSLSGRVTFLPKQQSREIIPQRRTGMVIYLFDHPESSKSPSPDLLLDSPRMQKSIQAFIGFDGRVSLENNNEYFYQRIPDGAPPHSGISSSRSGSRTYLSNSYPKSSNAQLPKWPCYGFWLLDKGWRVEMEVWTERCSETMEEEVIREADGEGADGGEEGGEDSWVSHRTFLQLDTPVSRNRRTRGVAIGKSGDGAIDFLARGLEHSNGASSTNSLRSHYLLALIFLLCAFSSTAPFLTLPNSIRNDV